MPATINILASEGSTSAALYGPMDFFNSAERIAARITGKPAGLANARLLSCDGNNPSCRDGAEISVSGSFADIQSGDIIFIPALSLDSPGATLHALDRCRPLIEMLGKIGTQAEFIAAPCSGVFILAEAGLLDGRRATTSWWLQDAFQDRYPAIRLDRDAIVTLDANILTAAGSSCWQDLCLRIIEKLAGSHFAKTLARYLMLDFHRQSQTPYQIKQQQTVNDELVKKAQTWIHANLKQDFKLEQLAAQFGITPRTLLRRFQAALNLSPIQYIQQLRVNKSKKLLESTNLPLSEIVKQCGYQNESAFRRLFKQQCKISPREYRAHFRVKGREALKGIKL